MNFLPHSHFVFESFEAAEIIATNRKFYVSGIKKTYTNFSDSYMCTAPNNCIIALWAACIVNVSFSTLQFFPYIPLSFEWFQIFSFLLSPCLLWFWILVDSTCTARLKNKNLVFSNPPRCLYCVLRSKQQLIYYIQFTDWFFWWKKNLSFWGTKWNLVYNVRLFLSHKG